METRKRVSRRRRTMGDPWRGRSLEARGAGELACRGTGTHRIERPGERDEPVESHQTTRGERRDGRLADGRRSAPASDGTMLVPGRKIRRASRDRTVAPFAGIVLLARHARCLRRGCQSRSRRGAKWRGRQHVNTKISRRNEAKRPILSIYNDADRGRPPARTSSYQYDRYAWYHTVTCLFRGSTTT